MVGTSNLCQGMYATVVGSSSTACHIDVPPGQRCRVLTAPMLVLRLHLLQVIANSTAGKSVLNSGNVVRD